MKQTKKLIALLSVATLVASTVACAPEQVDNDPRESIFISVFNGGYGREWLDDIVKDFNAERRSETYKIVVTPSKKAFNSIFAEVDAGTATYDMFYSNAEIYKMIDKNLLEDISDVWDSKPTGEGKTIRQMMVGAADYAKAYSDYQGNLYALPLQEGVRGFVYSHPTFLKYNLLFAETDSAQGTFITDTNKTLSVGKDGTPNTYDDGHPVTELQWARLITQAAQKLGYAFNYTGEFASYYNDIFEMFAAQYDGVETWKRKYTLKDGALDVVTGYNAETDEISTKSETVTFDNGYLFAQTPGNLKALLWMDEYFACKDGRDTLAYGPSAGLKYTYENAQTDFILMTAKNEEKKIAMLAEGDWWENESRGLFEELEGSKYDGYSFREHDYRFMTPGYFDGQKQQGNVYTIGENMYVALKKQTNEAKCEVCKDFLTYAYQPKYLQNYAVKTGGVMPYDVELDEAQEAQLSPFAKNLRQLYYDRENNTFINPMLMKNINYTCRAGLSTGCASGDIANPSVPGSGYWIALDALYKHSATDFFNAIGTYRQNSWSIFKSNYETYMRDKGATENE